MRAINYPLELRHDGGEIHAYSFDIPEAIASNATEVLIEMCHALTVAVRGRMKDEIDLGSVKLNS